MVCYLVRHGKDDETVRGGWSRFGLSDEGKAQVRNLVDHIAANQNELMIARLYSSDLPRAVETAMPISKELNLEVDFKAEFREINNGALAGMPNDIADEKYPGIFWNALGWDETYPQGESPHIFYERIKAAWQRFSETASRDGKNAILVTHGGVINVIYSLIDATAFSNKEKAERVPHATMIPLNYNNGIWNRL